jgi:hypothetical protein
VVLTDHLPSWSDTPTKQTLLDFVAAVTDVFSSDYVPPAARIAAFDNDGTLWCEKPIYVQLIICCASWPRGRRRSVAATKAAVAGRGKGLFLARRRDHETLSRGDDGDLHRLLAGSSPCLKANR